MNRLTLKKTKQQQQQQQQQKRTLYQFKWNKSLGVLKTKQNYFMHRLNKENWVIMSGYSPAANEITVISSFIEDLAIVKTFLKLSIHYE